MFTNYDAQQILNDQYKLAKWLTNHSNIKHGSDEITIHLYALKQILHELFIVRNYYKESHKY